MEIDPAFTPELIEMNGPDAGRRHRLDFGEHIIGRGANATVMLNVKDISRRHARLDVGPESVVLGDLGSKNGIHVNGDLLEKPRLLLHGDVVDLGELQLQVHHPSTAVKDVLSAAGETTHTTSRTHGAEVRNSSFILLPVAGVLVFAALVAVLLLV